MAKVSERVHVMKENFMALHEAGYSIPDIAKKYNLNNSTVYRCLQEIADANGVNREDLLQIVRNKSVARIFKEEEERVRVNVAEMQDCFKQAGATIGNIIGRINQILEEERV